MTQTDIANLALAKLGTEQVASIDSTSVKEAVHAKLHFSQAVDEVLRAHFWGFAMATVELVQETVSTTTQVVPWAAAYALPADFLKLKDVRYLDGVRMDAFELRRVNGKRCLLTNQPDGVLLAYVQRVADPTEYDPLFIAALVTLLASKMARAITGSDQLEGALRQAYVMEDLPAARCADGHDTQSAENHPLQELLDGSLTGGRADFLTDLDS